MENTRKVILYIAMSMDGFIAQPNDDLDFLSLVEKEGEDYGYANFIETVDAVIVGRKTYDKVLSMGFEFPHTDKDAYIITRTSRPDLSTVKLYSGSLEELIAKLKIKSGKNIFVDGGAEIVNQLLEKNLIDEFFISIIPILLGAGVALFQQGRPETRLQLISSKQFDTGLVQLHYIQTKDGN